MSKLIEKLASSFSSKNLCPNVTTDYDPDEFTLQFSDGIYVYTFILYDELGFEEPDFDEYFEDEDEYGNYTTNPLLTIRYVYYVIAIPQRDKLVLLKNRWDTLNNDFGYCDTESVFYRNILAVNMEDNVIKVEKVGGTISGIVLPTGGENLLEYQDYDPENPMTYSVTRTSNAQVFIKALEKLIAGFK